MRASGRSSSPGFGETKNSAASIPRADQAPSASGSPNRTSKRVRSMASSAASSSMPRANVAAARRRAAASDSAAARNSLPQAGLRATRAPTTARRPPSSSASSRRNASRRAMHSASVGPYLRFRRSNSASRSSICCSLAGDASMPSAYRRRNSARSSSCDLMPSRASTYGWKARVERGQVCDAAPDLAQGRQRGAVAFIERRVASSQSRSTRSAFASTCRGPRQVRHLPRLRRRPRGRVPRAGTPRAPAAPRGRRPHGWLARSSCPLVRHRSNKPATCSVNRPRPPKASTTSRCVAGSSRVWCSCCP